MELEKTNLDSISHFLGFKLTNVPTENLLELIQKNSVQKQKTKKIIMPFFLKDLFLQKAN